MSTSILSFTEVVQILLQNKVVVQRIRQEELSILLVTLQLSIKLHISELPRVPIQKKLLHISFKKYPPGIF